MPDDKPRMRVSTRIILTVVVVAAAVLGFNWYDAQRVKKIPTPPVKPGRFDLLGLKPSDRYAILVANKTAYITMGSGQETFERTGSGAGGTRIPTPDLLGAKAGDTEALGRLVVRLNKLKPEEAPPGAKLWPQADVEKALEGDEAMRRRLASDLGMPVQPRDPPPPLGLASLSNGIVLRIDVPVECEVPGRGRTTLTAHADVPYRPQIVSEWEARYEKEDYPAETLLALFAQMSQESHEDIAASLRGLYDESRVGAYGARVAHVLENTFVVLTEEHLTWAKSEEVPPAPYRTEPTYTLHMGLTREGRARLWKFSSVYGGRRVLVVIDGVALQGSELTEGLNVSKFFISRLEDGRRVADIVSLVNRQAAPRAGERQEVESRTADDAR